MASRSSALLAQMQANMRMAAQRAREKEEENRIAEQAAIAAASEGGDVPEELAEAMQLPALQPEQKPAEPPDVVAVAAQPEPTQAEPPSSDMERRMRSLSEVAVELARALIRAKNFINLAHVEIYGRRGRVPYETIRTAIKRLDKEGFFTYRGVGNYGMLKGMSYSLDSAVVEAFSKAHGMAAPEALSAEQPKSKSSGQFVAQRQEQPAISLDHPELTSWREFGLSEKQISLWITEFGIDPALMVQYLKWCAFDVANNHADNPVQNMANWFYAMLKNTGMYPKPAGYVSVEELRSRQLEQLRQQEVQSMQESMDRGLREYFDTVMSKRSEDPLYNELLASLNDFARRMENVPDSPVFRAAMWSAFRYKAGV